MLDYVLISPRFLTRIQTNDQRHKLFVAFLCGRFDLWMAQNARIQCTHTHTLFSRGKQGQNAQRIIFYHFSYSQSDCIVPNFLIF